MPSVDEIARAHATGAQLASPLLDALDQHGDAAESPQHRELGGLDALGERELFLAREQFVVAHLAEIGVDQIAREHHFPVGIGVGRRSRCRLGALATVIACVEQIGQRVALLGGGASAPLSNKPVHLNNLPVSVAQARARPARPMRADRRAAPMAPEAKVAVPWPIAEEQG